MGGSGKTTIVDTLQRLTREGSNDITPRGTLTKISMNDGATLCFDRGIFQSTKLNKIFYHVYTVGGMNRFSPLRKKIFKGTDAVIFVVDSQTHFLEDNIESLKELKNIARGKLVREIPMITLLNKQDLDDIIGEEDFKQVLIEEKLWYEPDQDFINWNPTIFKTCALYEKRRNIYQSFIECVKRFHMRDDSEVPYPYIFKPPSPPDDLSVAPQYNVYNINKEDEAEEEIYCQYCGKRLTKEEQLTHNCRKTPYFKFSI
jgi:GTPase SAR1 family protein